MAVGEQSEEALHIKWRRFALDLVTVGSQGEEGSCDLETPSPWDFFGRNDAQAETPVLWPPHAKS